MGACLRKNKKENKNESPGSNQKAQSVPTNNYVNVPDVFKNENTTPITNNGNYVNCDIQTSNNRNTNEIIFLNGSPVSNNGVPGDSELCVKFKVNKNNIGEYVEVSTDKEMSTMENYKTELNKNNTGNKGPAVINCTNENLNNVLDSKSEPDLPVRNRKKELEKLSSLENNTKDTYDVYSKPNKNKSETNLESNENPTQNSGSSKGAPTQLNYIQVEFVNNETGNGNNKPKLELKKSRSPSPVNYTDVLHENGKIVLKS